MKHLCIITVLVAALTACAQPKPQGIEHPAISSTLTVSEHVSPCLYDETPRYIVNNGSIIYQDCNTRVYTHADAATFRLPRYAQFRPGFALDKNGIYLKGHLIKTDTTGFAFVSGDAPVYWKTATKVYRDTIEITGMHAPTFKALDCSGGIYFTDKDFIYYNGKKIEGSHAASAYSYSCDNFCYDKNNVYIDGKIAYKNGKKLIPVNTELVKTTTTVYNRHTMKPVPGIDAATLKKLSDRYFSIDKNHVYFESKPLLILPADFKHVKVWDQVNSAYVSDGKKLYYRDFETITTLDATSFGMIPHSDYFYDKNGIYQRHYNSAKDIIEFHKFPFDYTVPVTPKTATRGNNSAYITYANQAYDLATDEVFKDLTPEQTALINNNSLRLSKTRETVTQYDNKLYKAGGIVYWDDEDTGANAATFERIDYTYYKDKNNIYIQDHKKGLIMLSGIDTATAKEFNGFLADKDAVYYNNYRLMASTGIELLGVFPGYRLGCGLDTQPGSNYYLFRNTEGYWLVRISNNVIMRHLGTALPDGWNPRLARFDIQ